MTTARSSKPRGATRPKAPPRPRIAVRDVPLAVELDEEEEEVLLPPRLAPEFLPSWFAPEPHPEIKEEPEPEPVVRFPLEKRRGGLAPIAVFNSPTSPRERLAFPERVGRRPIAFDGNGLLLLYDEEDAEIVRNNNPGGRTYVEGDPRLEHNPFVCDDCFPKSRWYSQSAFQRHMKFKHSS